MAYFRCGGGGSGGGGAKVTLNGEPNTDSWAITYEGGRYSYPMTEMTARLPSQMAYMPRVAFDGSIYIFNEKNIYAWSKGAESWTTLGSTPYKCYEAFIYNGIIHLVFYVSDSETYELWTYNGRHLSSGGLLTKIEDLPFLIHSEPSDGGIVVIGNKIYKYYSKSDSSIILMEYNGGTWTSKTIPFSIIEKSNIVIFNYNNELHIANMCNTSLVPSNHYHYKYNDNTNVITAICRVPYVNAGTTTDSNGNSASFYQSPAIIGRNQAQLGEHLYVISDHGYTPGNMYKYYWCFDGSKWSRFDCALESPQPAAIKFNDSIYTIGGWGSDRFYRYIDFIPNYSVTKVE